MAIDIQKRTARNLKWNEENMKKVTVQFALKRDAEVLEWLEKQPNKTDAIRTLILGAIEKEKTGQ